MEVSKQIIEVVDALAQRFGVAIDWSKENVMPYIVELGKKYINWEIATSVLWCIIGITCLVVAIWLSVKAKSCWAKYTNANRYNDYDVMSMFLWMGCGVLITFGVCTIFEQLFDIVKCCTFPEYKLYEFAQTLLK